MSTTQIIITGLVQGVSFRHYAKKTSMFFGLTGFAKNLEDGSVEIVIQGSKDNINKFINWCKKGPELADVKSLKIKDVSISENFKGFEIKY